MPDRRALRRLTQFSGAFPMDALVALSPRLGAEALERLLTAGALLRDDAHGFRVDPVLGQLARAVTLSAKAQAADLVALGSWLLDHITAVEHSATHTSAAFDHLEPLVGDIQAVTSRLGPHEPRLAAELWCAIADLLFYRRVLPFDCPEYELAIRCADETRDDRLRVHARIAAGRAMIEVKSPSHARGYFEEAREIAVTHGLGDWQADAVRGLGWVVLAEGNVDGAKELFSRAHTLHQSTQHARGIADACMALGVLSVLLSRREEADQIFFRAEAILRARHDTERLAKLATLRHTLGLASDRVASVEVDLHRLLSRGQYWRGALLLLRSEQPDATQHAQILADLAGVSWKELVASSQAPSLIRQDKVAVPSWELRCDGLRRVLVGPDGVSHDLTRRGPLVKVLTALARSESALSATSLFEAAWPDERVRHEAALFRVYTTVRRLRSIGVPIATSGDGYFCDLLRSGD